MAGGSPWVESAHDGNAFPLTIFGYSGLPLGVTLGKLTGERGALGCFDTGTRTCIWQVKQSG